MVYSETIPTFIYGTDQSDPFMVQEIATVYLRVMIRIRFTVVMVMVMVMVMVILV